MPIAKNKYSIKVKDIFIHVKINRMEHLLPQGPDLSAIIPIERCDKKSNKSKDFLSASRARAVFRDFFRMLIMDLIENNITFMFPRPGIALRIEDIAPIHEYDVKRPHLSYNYDKKGGKQKVYRSARQAYIYQPVLRFFLVPKLSKDKSWYMHNYLFRLILNAADRKKLNSKVLAKKTYFSCSVK